MLMGAVVLTGCEYLTAPASITVVLRSDQTSFEIALEGDAAFGDLTFTITNVGTRTRWLATPQGDPFRLQRFEKGKWRTVWSPAYAAVGWPAPTPLRPGERRNLVVKVYGFRGDEAGWPRSDPVADTDKYRVVFGSVFLTREGTRPDGDLVPVEERTSNAFTLRASAR